MVLKIIVKPAGIYAANCYIVFSEKTRSGIVIDPGGDVDDIVSNLDKNNIHVKYIVLTHGHGDHIGGVKELKEKLNVPVVIHKEDAEMLEDASLNLSSTMAMGEIEITPDKTVEDGDTLVFGELKGRIIHTPGHTMGGMCLLVEENLFCGDTLFKGSVGRSDLYGGNHGILMNSIKEKILTLPDNIMLYPGHGEPTTVGEQRATNPFLR
ncbi:MBL fold metallo-hydrolase [Tissierellaceae bacterium BX21]|jgi:glyoxylase-like metal-dependent hydrolase (beta-lactamase superfamily II)|uniref:MBL fold metallo-hydrolase n=1 Tax=Paratissierella segnis TaxID=2763679 RepID=A0A926EUU5_9FIRM|nr:MBL fold metallo-hydrolase [Paratissierella segnis]MBC8588683.1 MBL fold metallo-hydrolase [Paratissierella segnis]